MVAAILLGGSEFDQLGPPNEVSFRLFNYGCVTDSSEERPLLEGMRSCPAIP
jgi:hypothetical protein